jgi:hypothetical protein
MYQSLAAKGFWEIDSKRILCASSWLGLCFPPHAGPTNHRSHILHRMCLMKSLVLRAYPQSLQHLSSTVPQPAEMITLEGSWGID